VLSKSSTDSWQSGNVKGAIKSDFANTTGLK
jgi:hypothetical protein